MHGHADIKQTNTLEQSPIATTLKNFAIVLTSKKGELFNAKIMVLFLYITFIGTNQTTVSIKWTSLLSSGNAHNSSKERDREKYTD